MNICDEKKLNKINFIKQNNTNPGRLEICRGYLFVYSGAFLSVGETCGLPRANIVRPYRVLVKDFAISPLILHAVAPAVFVLSIRVTVGEHSICSRKGTGGYGIRPYHCGHKFVPLTGSRAEPLALPRLKPPRSPRPRPCKWGNRNARRWPAPQSGAACWPGSGGRSAFSSCRCPDGAQSPPP